MEHCGEFDTPGIAALFSVFIDKDGGVFIDIFGQVCIMSGAEYGAGLGVWIEEFEISGR